MAHCARRGEKDLTREGERRISCERGWCERSKMRKVNGGVIDGRLEEVGSQLNSRMVQQCQGSLLVGIQVGRRQEEEKRGEEG